MKRWPRGYVGTNHETIGSSLLSVLQILTMPEQVLGADDVRRLQEVNPKQWYRVDWLLSLMDKLDRVAGHYGLMNMGRRRFELSHKKRLPIRSARDLVYGIDNMYRFANRGQDIGGWKVLRFEPGLAELEKTTPHHCRMEQGLLAAALAEAKCPGIITQTQCFRQGADSCIYTISSAFTGVNWSGEP